MGHISKLTNQASQKDSRQTENAQNNKLMSNLWERMGYIYGHKFSSTYGESAVNDDNSLTEAARTWASGLRGLTGEQIANGLRQCVNCGASWPPTLPEFVKMCKGEGENEYGLNYVPEYHRVENRRERLIESDENKETHKKAYQAGMSGIKDILNK